ncbi:MAG: hypothetical protein GX621_06655 [Pirellulaceae bacterium]|nr:hypothetical protein [Pirellulaceae bacterium]
MGIALRRSLTQILIVAACAAVSPMADAAHAQTTRSLADAPGSELRALLRIGGIDDDAWAGLREEGPWADRRQDTLQKILFRMAGLSADDLDRWADDAIDWKQLVADPANSQGRLFRLEGIVQSIQIIPTSPETARRFQTQRIYRAQIAVERGSRTIVVFARAVPEAWRRGGTIEQPGGAEAVFLTLQADADAAAEPTPVFAAARLASYADDRLLGRIGMDLGLLDAVLDRRPIRPEERECFYRLLDAAARADQQELIAAARRGEAQFAVEPLFNDPASQRGRLAMLSGHVRRALRVRVDDPDIRRRFGIDHYYELYLYTDDSQGNPLVFCVRELPEGMPTGEGPDYIESVTVPGFFMKSWAYASGQTLADEIDAQDATKAEPPALQVAPLLIGRAPVWHRAEESGSSPAWGAIGGGLFVLILLGLWIWLWRRSKNDRRFTTGVNPSAKVR